MIALPPALRLAMWTRPTWELSHADGSTYLERVVLWGADCLDNHDRDAASHAFVHTIHTADGDRHPHDHPWAWAVAVVLSGGYSEVRRGRSPDSVRARGYAHHYVAGDVNVLRPGEYHTITSVKPGTRTLFLCGREVSDWGFLVDGRHVPHAEYFERDDVQRMTHARVS